MQNAVEIIDNQQITIAASVTAWCYSINKNTWMETKSLIYEFTTSIEAIATRIPKHVFNLRSSFIHAE